MIIAYTQRLSFQWVFDANATDDLSMVQIFGPQSFAAGAFGGHDDQRIPKRQPIDDRTIDGFFDEHGRDYHSFKPFQRPEDVVCQGKVMIKVVLKVRSFLEC